jgi:pimeloyl-ACP methyl ester carboxylesterase
LGARHDLHLFGDRKVDRATSVMMLLDAAPPHLALIDAFVDVPDGLLGMMGRPDPVHPLRLYGARDPVALDATVARHVGVPAPGLLGTATDWFGDPRAVTQVVGPDTPIAGWRAADQSIRTAVLSALALPVFTHASARGALFMPRFDTQAFPALQPPSSGLRAARAAVWTALEQPGAPSHGPGLLPVHFERHAESLLRVSRTGQGPPIVLLHGYPDTLQVWCRLAGRLAATHTVIALDWPGLGYSGGWGDQADPQALAAQVRRLLQAWDLHDVTLVGADMGGPPALLAADSPRVARVAVIGSLLFADGPTSVEISTMRTIGLAGLAFRWAPRLVWKRCMGTFLRLGERLPEVLEADMFAAFEQPAVRARLAAMCLAYERALPQLPDCYWKVSKPVLTLWGEDDHHFGPEHGARLAALLPNCRAEVCPSGPHWVAWSDPDWVASALTRFCVEGP